MLKKLALIIFSAAIALSFAACDTAETAFYSGDTKISSGLYMYYLFNAFNEGTSLQTDTTVEYLDGKIDETPVRDWIKNKAKELCTEYITVEKKFAELKLAFTEEEQSNISSNAQYYYQQYQTYYSSNGIGYASYLTAANNQSKKQKIFEHLFGEEGETPVAADEKKAFFVENYAKVTSISFAKTNDEGELLDDAGKAAVKAEAEKYAVRVRKGENIEALIVEHNNAEAKKQAEAAGSEAPEPTELAEDADSSELVSKIVPEGEEAVSQKTEKIFSEVKAGTTGVIEDDDNYYVIKREDIAGNDELYEEQKTSVLMDIKEPEFKEIIKGYESAYTIKSNGGIVRKYSPDKIDMTSGQEQQAAY